MSTTYSGGSGELKAITLVCVDLVHLSAHTALVELPEALRGLTMLSEEAHW